MLGKILKMAVIAPIRLYQLTLSPLLGAGKCRYKPSCSHFMVGAIEEWGILRGGWMGIKRIGRCHPWSKTWGDDPVPKNEKAEKGPSGPA